MKPNISSTVEMTKYLDGEKKTIAKRTVIITLQKKGRQPLFKSEKV